MQPESDKPGQAKTPIGDPPRPAEPIKVYEDRSREPDEAETANGPKQEERKPKKDDAGNDEETMPIEEGFSVVP